MKIYLAGGAVRDLLRGVPVHDRDYLVTQATEQAFRERFPEARKVGLAFPVFLVDHQEFSFPRAASLTKELCARDFTVNALLVDENGEMICHPHGLEDLRHRVLRPCSPSSLRDDPLRCFRGARLLAQHPDFSPHADLLPAMAEAAPLLESLPPDRVGQEVRKALAAPRPGTFLRTLRDGRCLAPRLREFEPMDDLDRLAALLDGLAGHEITVWMGLCHELSQEVASALGQRLRLPNAHIRAGERGARWFTDGARYPDLTPETKVDLLMDLHLEGRIEPFFALVRAAVGHDHLATANQDLQRILAVNLPKDQRNLGSESGVKLRRLRAHAIM